MQPRATGGRGVRTHSPRRRNTPTAGTSEPRPQTKAITRSLALSSCRATFVCWPTAPGSVARVRLAGVSVREEDVDLARLLFGAGLEDTGDALLVALDAEQDLVALSVADREAILRVLDDPPIGLAELLRGVLLAEHQGRMRDGLV
jgi:hypothetical protein